ncbi:hypothetical protein [uncultured Sphingomonas sp.]|uniref:hypothetical protein n=1 Tax=uncultured Sphingomonas sp. TaxID=158754 RepID=UPI0037494135
MNSEGQPEGKKFKSNWYWIILLFVVTLLAAYIVGRFHGIEAQYKVDAIAVDARAAAADAVELCENAGARLETCLRRAIATAENDGHDAQELTAQQQAAWAGIITTLVGFLSAGGAILGLVWVKATLDATRKSLDHAREANSISDSAIRAWVSIENPQVVGLVKESDGSYSALWTSVLRNYGNYPATDIITVAVCTPTNTFRDEAIEKLSFLHKQIADTQEWSEALAPSAETKGEDGCTIDLSIIKKAEGQEGRFSLWMGCYYKTKKLKEVAAFSVVEVLVHSQVLPGNGPSEDRPVTPRSNILLTSDMA